MAEISEFADSMRAAVKAIEAARNILSRGPLEFYLMKLVEHSEALITRFAPLHIGDRARIVKHVPCKGGWLGSEKTLAIGAVGVIVDVDYSGGQFLFDFVADRQWWRDQNGEYHEKLGDNARRSSFRLSESFLSKEKP